MERWTITITDEVAAADVQTLEDRINAFNVATPAIDDARLLASFVRDRGAIVAGIYGWTWGGCCEIRYLWVSDERRGLGCSKPLSGKHERAAVQRSCSARTVFKRRCSMGATATPSPARSRTIHAATAASTW